MEISPRCLHKSCSVFRALSNGIWFGGLSLIFENSKFSGLTSDRFFSKHVPELLDQTYIKKFRISWATSICALKHPDRIYKSKKMHFSPTIHDFWHFCTVFSRNLWWEGRIQKMFAPVNSAHRTEQSDTGFGVSGWLLKFDPPDPGTRTRTWKIRTKPQNHVLQVEYSQKLLTTPIWGLSEIFGPASFDN